MYDCTGLRIPISITSTELFIMRDNLSVLGTHAMLLEKAKFDSKNTDFFTAYHSHKIMKIKLLRDQLEFNKM